MSCHLQIESLVWKDRVCVRVCVCVCDYKEENFESESVFVCLRTFHFT
jgi:hypothetical protein